MTERQPGRPTATLRIISPCEHGVHHSILSVVDGTEAFSVPECKDSKGNRRSHKITPEKYPEVERRR